MAITLFLFGDDAPFKGPVKSFLGGNASPGTPSFLGALPPDPGGQGGGSVRSP